MAAATDAEKSDVPSTQVQTTLVEGAAEYFIDPDEDKKVLRRIDLFITPLMFAVFFFQFLDKSCINYAAVFGLETDTHLDADGFSWVISMFYFGLLVAQWPCTYLISRFPVAKVVGVTIILWGAVEMCMAATQSFAGLASARFFLGICEGAASPSFVILTSNWYKRKEHPIRVAWWESTSGYSQIIGAVLMYLIGGAHMSLASWRVMFLVCGGATMLSGIVFVIYMPKDTTTAWFLKEHERKIATERLALDRATRDHSSFDLGQVKEGLLDIKTWLLFLMAFFICIPSPILKFSSLVINGFGFSKFQTMLVGLPSGALQIFFIWAGALGTEYTHNLRCLFGILLSIVPLVGSALLMALPASAKWGIVVATWLAAMSSDLIVVTVSLIASNVKGNTKKATVSAVYFVGYCIGCIAGPQLWQAPDAPRYTKGCISSVVSWCLLIVTFVVYYIVAKMENTKRAKMALAVATREGTVVPVDGKEAENLGVTLDSDMTDKQDVAFRYTL